VVAVTCHDSGVPFVISLALAQLRHRRARWALLGLGVALVVAVPVVASGLAAATSARAVRHAIAGLAPEQRMITVNQDTVPPAGQRPAQDATVRADLAGLTGHPVRRELGFRQLEVRSVEFLLTATDGLPSAVTVTSGRLPRECRPEHCEVVLVGSAATPALRQAVGDLGVEIVGTAERRDPLLVAGPYDPGATPVLVGDGVDAMSELAALDLFGRHLDWVSVVDADRVVADGTDDYVRRSHAVAEELSRTLRLTMTAPSDVLQAADARADTSTRRFGLLGGVAAALLLGFTVVAAAGLRREAALLAGIMRRHGSRTGQVVLVLALAAAAVAVVAAVLGSAGGAVLAGALSGGSGLPAGGVAGRALGASAWTVAVLATLAGAVVVGVLSWADGRARAVWQLLDVVALACLGAAALAVDRGDTSLAGGSDPLVSVLPVLASVVVGVVAARLWAPVAGLVARVLPRRSLAGRIGLLGAVRRPLRPVATAALVAAAVASVVFAAGYRTTLRDGASDQAAFQVPLDVTLAASSHVLNPALVVDPARLAASVPGLRVFGVGRTAASVSPLPGVVDSVPLLAVQSGALAAAHDWGRTTGSDLSAADLTRDLTGGPAAAGRELPAGTRQVVIAQHGASADLAITLYLRTPGGRETGVTLTPHGSTLVADLPDLGTARPTVFAVGIDESEVRATRHAHAVGEGDSDVPLVTGDLTLGAPVADGVPVPWDWSGWGTKGTGTSATAASLDVHFVLDGTPTVALPGYAAVATGALPVAVDPATARLAKNGLLQLKLDGTTAVTARVVATLPRLPTTDGRFVLADLAAVADKRALAHPGQSPGEYWLAVPSTHAGALVTVLAAAPYARLAISDRRVLSDRLAGDPVSQGSYRLLSVVGLLAFGVALLALLLLVIGERRDGAGELYAWESDGLSPRVLRRMLAVRAALVAAVGVPVGVLGGLVLTRVGVTLVAVDASGARPTPPLQASLGTSALVVQLVGGVAVALAGCWAIAATMLRERLPVPAEVDLR